MLRLLRNRGLSPALKELGCGLVTVILFTLPLWAFSAAARGPRHTLTVLAGLVIVLAAIVIIGRLVRRG